MLVLRSSVAREAPQPVNALRQTETMTPDDWRKLRVGDRIRFVAMPTGFDRTNCHRDTLRAYQMLMARRLPVRVCHLDEWKMPWVQFRVPISKGRWEHHQLLINHDGWVRVRVRTRTARA